MKPSEKNSIKTILIPTGGSEDAISIVEYAIATFGTELHYILQNGFTCDFAQGKREDGTKFSSREEQQAFMMQHTLDALEAKKAVLIEKHGEIDIKCLAMEGSELQSIFATVLRKSVDLVVVGTKTTKQRTPTYSSTLANRLVGSLKAHILVVPFGTEPIPIEHMVITYADLELSNSMFGPLNYLVTKFNTKCTMLQLNPGKHKTLKPGILSEALADFIGVESYTERIEESKHIVESIMDYCDELEPELLVTFTKEESYNEDFWTGSEIDELLHFLQQPMLVLWEG